MDIPVYIETPTVVVPGIELGEALRDQGFRLGESCSVLSELLLCVLFTSSCFYKVVGYPPRCE